jgi:hypothetical protein
MSRHIFGGEGEGFRKFVTKNDTSGGGEKVLNRPKSVKYYLNVPLCSRRTGDFDSQLNNKKILR